MYELKKDTPLKEDSFNKANVISAAVNKVSVGVLDVSYKVNQKEILSNVYLIAKPGRLLSVIGPSGAGKSTLLECMAGRVALKHLSGKITFNGVPITKAIAQRTCVYIPCEQRMLPYLTVYETLMVAANLKLYKFSVKERKEKVDELIFEIGLDRCKNTIIGSEWRKGISTGERKRVQIAVELLGNPSIIIADEPTTGLDSGLACEIFQIFKNLAGSGKTVILSIHQASSQIWSMFDQLMILSSGQCLYFGEAALAKQWFAEQNLDCLKSYNPADFLLHIASQYQLLCISRSYSEIGQNSYSVPTEQHRTSKAPDIELNNNLRFTFENSELYKNLITSLNSVQSEYVKNSAQIRLPKTEKTIKRRFNEIRVLSKRSFINSLRNPIVCCIILLVQLLQGLILGGVFWQLTGKTNEQAPVSIDSNKIMNYSLTKLLVNGIEGKQPLFEFLTNGVDQNKSQPLIELFSDPYWLINSFNILSCGLPKLKVFQSYNDYGVRPTQPLLKNAAVLSDINPAEGTGALVGLTQLLDHLYLHEDWSHLKPYENSSIFWYINLMDIYQHVILAPWMSCANFPVLGDSLTFFSQAQKSSVKKRQLLSLNDIDVSLAIQDVAGIYGPDLIQSWFLTANSLSTCSHSVCKSFESIFTFISSSAKKAFDAFLTTENIVSALFFFVANIGFSSYDALITFPNERLLYNQEISNQLYSTSSYFLAKNIAEIPFQFMPNFLMVSVFYFMVGLNINFSQYIYYCIICFGVTFAAYGFGYLISATCPKLQLSILIAPFVLVVWLTTAGFFLRDFQIPSFIYWFSDIGFYKWGFISLILNQFPKDKNLGILSNKIPLLLAGVQYESLAFTIFILYLLGFVYRSLAYFSLKYTNRGVYAKNFFFGNAVAPN